MNLSVNGQSQVPPGFRFHPTEEELLQYYLQKKVANQKIDLDVIQDIDLNRLEPWDIQEKCRIGSTPQNDWYFFSHKDKKYPTGTRTNRATVAGFWKATGRDKVIYSSLKRIGMRKTLVFYKGRAPHGEKSDWIMHEYRLDDNTFEPNLQGINLGGDQSFATEEGWVVCRVFKKKNYVKALDNPAWSSKASPEAHDLDEILSYMEKTTTKEESKRTIGSSKINNITVKYTENTENPVTNLDHIVQDRFMHLPHLGSPIPETVSFDTVDSHHETMVNYTTNDHHHTAISTVNWVELDRLVAYQLNGQQVEHSESRGQLPYFTNDTIEAGISPFPLLGEIDGSDDRIATNTFSFQHLLCSQPSRAFEVDTNGNQTWTQFAASRYDIS